MLGATGRSEDEAAGDAGAVADAVPPPSPRGWSEPGVGHAWQHRFFDHLIMSLGKRPAYHMMYLVTFWYCLFCPGIRRRTRHYLDRRFPERRRSWQRFLDSHRLVRSFGKTLVDLAAHRLRGEGAGNVVCPDAQILRELRDRDSGLIVVNAHVGCWQVAMSVLGDFARPVHLVMLPSDLARMPFDPRVAGVIDPRTGLAGILAMMQALRGGEIVCLMGDRLFGEDHHELRLPFLGAPAGFPVTPYRLASATGAPVVTVFTRRRDLRTYELQVAGVIEVAPDLGRETAKYRRYGTEFVGLLERFVQEHPWDYFNFFDVWAASGDGR